MSGFYRDVEAKAEEGENVGLLAGADADSRPDGVHLEVAANLGLPTSQEPTTSSFYIEMERKGNKEKTEEAENVEVNNAESENVIVENVEAENVELENVEAENVELENVEADDEETEGMSRSKLSVMMNLNTCLLNAIDDHNNSEVSRLLHDGASPNATCEYTYMTACHLAAFSNEEALQMLLDAGANRESPDVQGVMPLHYAAWSDAPRKVAMILGFPKDLMDRVATVHRNLTAEEKADISALKPAVTDIANRRAAPLHLFLHFLPHIPEENKTNEDRDFCNFPPLVANCSALHAASDPAHPHCLRLLLAAGANPNVKDDSNATPLDVVGYSCPIDYVENYVESIHILREYGGELSRAESVVLEVALRMHSLEALALLLDAGAPISQWNSNGKTALHVCVELKLKKHLHVLCNYSRPEMDYRAVDVVDINGNTVLHSAAKKCWSEGVRVALEARADITAKNRDGDTALHLAAAAGNYDIVQKILKADIQKRYNLRQENVNEKSIFSNAIYSGNVDIVKCLLERENELRDFLDRRVDGMTPLQFTAKKNYDKLFLLILNNQKSELDRWESFRLIDILAQYDRVELFTEMLKSNFMKYPIDEIIATNFLLHTAIVYGSRKMIITLLGKGADLSQRNASGQTALGLLMYHITKPTEFLEEIFDSCIKNNHKNIYDKDCEITVDYSILMPVEFNNYEDNIENENNTNTQVEFVREMNVLDALIETGNLKGQRSLLAHPFVESFLHLKWRNCKKFIYTFITIYAFFLVSVNVYIISVYYYTDNYDREVLPFFDPGIWEICIFVSLFFVIIMEFFIWNLKKRWFFEWETWVKFMSILLGAALPIISLTLDSEGTDWCRVLALFTTVSSWVNMMIYLSWTPTWGYYMQMYGKVSMKVLKIMFISAIPIICFAISFMILFHARTPFDGPWAALFKTIVMMTSEFDYKDLVESQNITSELDCKDLAESQNLTSEFDCKDLAESKNLTSILLFRVVFLFFVVFVSIVLMNLITGVAVNDMQALTHDGNLRRLEKQVDRLCMLEILFNKKLFKCIDFLGIVRIPTQVKIQPNRNIFKNDKIKEKIMNKAKSLMDLKEKKADDISIKTKLDEILKNMHSKDSCTENAVRVLTDLVEKTIEKSVYKIINKGTENVGTELFNDAQNKYMNSCVEKTVEKAVNRFLEALAKNKQH